LDHLPDISHFPEITTKQMQIWSKMRKKDRGKPFGPLPGVKGAWMNTAMDFAAKHAKWAVIAVERNGKKTDLTLGTIVVIWLRYVSQMVR
jgi:hypothetical protein